MPRGILSLADQVAATTSTCGACAGADSRRLFATTDDDPDRDEACIVGRDPNALWFDDYEDQALFHEAGRHD